MLFVKGDVTPSTKVRDDPHKAWILIEILKKGECEILTTWCTCVAGSSLWCNHIITLMYKLNYAYKKGFNNPLCTSLPEGRKKGTRKEVTPKRISEFFIRSDSYIYISGRTQQVSIDGTLSTKFDLECGVPQGSCLEPLLFVVYASKIFEIVGNLADLRVYPKFWGHQVFIYSGYCSCHCRLISEESRNLKNCCGR